LIFATLDEANIKMIKHAFIEMDANNDGLITMEDLNIAKKNHLINSQNWMDNL
jgi:Ca2+-binding EF-hand superfamily protein